jgi:hypothetical protein
MIDSNRMHIPNKPAETAIDILLLRGGHLYTNEYPEAFRASIAKSERGLSTIRSRQ